MNEPQYNSEVDLQAFALQVRQFVRTHLPVDLRETVRSGRPPEREQLVMQLYYVEELNLKEIGEVLEVSESRVSQILSAVVKKLRGNLQVDDSAVSKPSRRAA
jgi:RNA polymerase sigma factor (sigma-70 family)